jgi:hypothetical protein
MRLRCGFIRRIGDCVLVVGRRMVRGGRDEMDFIRLVSPPDSTRDGLNHRMLS